MPFDTIREPDHNLVITVPFGPITDDELVAHYAERLEEGTLGAGPDELVDGRWIDRFDVTAEGQERLVDLLERNAERLGEMKWAFIADSMVAFGMFRMFEGQKADLPFETAVFRTPGAAAEWLTVDRGVLYIEPPV